LKLSKEPGPPHQWLKKPARGYRNRDRFRTAIYFHLGGLDLYPDSLTFNSKP